MTFHNIGNAIIPTDEVIFFRGVAQPPTRCLFLRLPHDIAWKLCGIKSYQKKYSTARRHCKWWTGLGESSPTAELDPKSIGFRWYNLATRLWFGAKVGSLPLSHVKHNLIPCTDILTGMTRVRVREYETADVFAECCVSEDVIYWWWHGSQTFSEHHVKRILEWCINMVLPSHYHGC